MISSAIADQSPFFIAEIFTTTSNSSAPSTMAKIISAIFASVALYPKGNPITVATCTVEPASFSFANFTKLGGTHTAAKSYCLASAHNFSMSATKQVGFKIVWSMYLLSGIFSMTSFEFFSATTRTRIVASCFRTYLNRRLLYITRIMICITTRILCSIRT